MGDRLQWYTAEQVLDSRQTYDWLAWSWLEAAATLACRTVQWSRPVLLVASNFWGGQP